jgi:hypothetical protein
MGKSKGSGNMSEAPRYNVSGSKSENDKPNTQSWNQPKSDRTTKD